jgi:hypothetical protein
LNALSKSDIFDGYDWPLIKAHFERRYPVREDLFVIGNIDGGNGCGAEQIWFLRIQEGKSPQKTRPIERCNDINPPEIEIQFDDIALNYAQGGVAVFNDVKSGPVDKAETWIYSSGVLRKSN